MSGMRIFPHPMSKIVISGVHENDHTGFYSQIVTCGNTPWMHYTYTPHTLSLLDPYPEDLGVYVACCGAS